MVSSKNEKMPILDHLKELRKRLIIIVVVNIVAALFCYQYIDVIMQYIMNLSDGIDLIYITPSELFLVYIKISLICGIVLSSPITLLEVWLFISKGLYKKEKIYVVISLILGTIFFITGVVFCYKVVLPVILSFFVRITITDVKAMISIESYVSFVNTLLLCFGGVFEMPVVVLLLSIFGMLKPSTLISKQRVFVLIIFVAAALITPPDIVSQVLLGIPMILLFELSIGICWLVDKNRNKKAAIE